MTKPHTPSHFGRSIWVQGFAKELEATLPRPDRAVTQNMPQVSRVLLIPDFQRVAGAACGGEQPGGPGRPPLPHRAVEGRYMSRSEAVMATALAAAGAGWTETAWRDALRAGGLGEWADTQRRKTGTRRPRNPADAERRLTTTWAKAARRVAERPPAADAPSVHAELAAVLTAADHNPAAWRGASGVTDRAVLAALVDVAASD